MKHSRLLPIAAAAVLLLRFAPAQTHAENVLATYNIGSGAATFGLALPAGSARDGVAVGALETQTDVKNRWPDGSIRFAVISVLSPAAGKCEIRAASAARGSFTPAWPQAEVRFATERGVFSARLPAHSSADAWLDGPVVKESRVTVVPVDAGGTAHPLLQVIFDVRSYRGGFHRVDITAQNIKDTPANDLVTYNVEVFLNNASVFSKAGVTHYYLTRWRKVFRVGLEEADVLPDFEPFYLARALPRYLPSIENRTYDTSGPNFEIMNFGTLAAYMMTPGGRAEIAPFPYWTAQYLVHKEASQRAIMLAHADLSASWSMQIAEPDGGITKLTSATRGYWLDGRAWQYPDGPRAFHNSDVGIRGQRGIHGNYEKPDHEHLPNLNLVPYLITGDRYYADQLRFWANWAVLAVWPGSGTVRGVNSNRQGEQGLLASLAPRGMAWSLREMVSAASFLPDADSDRSYFREKVQNNLGWFGRYVEEHPDGGPMEALFWELSGNSQAPYLQISLWQLSYLAWAIDWAEIQGFALGSAKEFRNRAIRSQIKLFTSAPDYPPEYCCPYYPRVAFDESTGGVRLIPTIKELFEHNYVRGLLAPSPRQPIVGYYGPEAWLLVGMGARDGMPGAWQAIDWLFKWNEPTGGTVAQDLAHRAGFAIAFVNPQAPRAPAGLHIK